MSLIDTIDYFIFPIKIRVITVAYILCILMMELFLRELVAGYSDTIYRVLAVASVICVYAFSGIIGRTFDTIKQRN